MASIARKTFLIAAVATVAVWVLGFVPSLKSVCVTAAPFGIWITLGSGIWYLWSKRKQPKSPITVKRVMFFTALGLCGLTVLGQFVSFMGGKVKQKDAAAPRATGCSDAAKIITVMLAKDGYHVTVPSPSGSLGTDASIGSTDMTEATVEEVKAALGAEHSTLMQLRAAGCTRIGFYGDKLGAFGKDIDLDDLP